MYTPVLHSRCIPPRLGAGFLKSVQGTQRNRPSICCARHLQKRSVMTTYLTDSAGLSLSCSDPIVTTNIITGQICDPSDQNESHVSKWHCWENDIIWPKVILWSFSDFIENGQRNMSLTFLISHTLWINCFSAYFLGFCDLLNIFKSLLTRSKIKILSKPSQIN